MRAEKSNLVEEITSKIKGSPYVLVTDYAGMQVEHFNELRKRLRGVGARYTVVKNTIFRLALKEQGLPELNDLLIGQTAIVAGLQDVCAAAKILKNFTAEFTKPQIRGGILDNAVMNSAQIGVLADLPSREALLAQLLGLIQTPANKLACVIAAPGQQLARVIQAKVNKGG